MKNTIFIICLLGYLGAIGQVSALLDTNDISAKISSDGSLFSEKFEVPKGSHRNTYDRVNIWIGGYDEFNNLHLTAQTFASPFSTDLFFGPIAANYYDSFYMSRYNNVWKIDKSEIDFHKANFNTKGYIVPKQIANWPGNGNINNGEAGVLAPYIDVNSNNIYDPVNGDYPDIRGDQAIFFITNDSKSIHTNSNSEMLGIELHGMAYSFASKTDSAQNETVFVNFQIFNRSINDYNRVYFTVFTEFSVPFNFIEYVGCDSSLNMSYIYNGNSNDLIYGSNSPAQGCIILNHPLSSFMYYNNGSFGNPPAATTDPNITVEYYRYLTGKWKNGAPLTRGGIGYNPGSIDTAKFAFNGDPNGTGWTELGDKEGDRRGITTIGPFDFLAGSTICVDLAFPYARDYTGNNLTSINILRQRARSIQTFYNNQGFDCPTIPTAVHESNKETNLISIYPNPNNGIFQIALNHFQENKNCNLEIYNTIGAKVYQSSNLTINQFNNVTIDISSQPPGIYFIKTNDGQRYYSNKIIVH